MKLNNNKYRNHVLCESRLARGLKLANKRYKVYVAEEEQEKTQGTSHYCRENSGGAPGFCAAIVAAWKTIAVFIDEPWRWA